MPSSLPFPPIYLLPVHLETERLHELEEQIPTLTYDPNETDVFVGNVSKPERALFELRRRDISFKAPEPRERLDRASGVKKRKLSDGQVQEKSRTLKVARLKWFTDSLERGGVMPLDEYLVVEVEREAEKEPPRSSQHNISLPTTATPKQPATGDYRPRRDADQAKKPPLLQQSTSDEVAIPPVPEFLNMPYSCQRPTPVDTPNASFVDELKKIRKTRILTGDAVGIRAYSTSIASVAAYPYPLKSQLGKLNRKRAYLGARLLKTYVCHGYWIGTLTISGCRSREVTRVWPEDRRAVPGMERHREDRRGRRGRR